jgi:hypothetical protein
MDNEYRNRLPCDTATGFTPMPDRRAYTRLTDTDKMPWGKHKDTPMQDVPASYFFWLWTEAGKEHDKQCPVADYIRRNLDVLKQEHTDGIW